MNFARHLCDSALIKSALFIVLWRYRFDFSDVALLLLCKKFEATTFEREQLATASTPG